MNLKQNFISLIMCAIATVGWLEPAFAISTQNYFIRPVLRVGSGEIIDGLQVNGPTSGTLSQGVVGYSESTVNLNDGTVKMYAEEFAPLDGLQTFGSFGERLTITNGSGTNWDINFTLEGGLTTFGGDPINPSAPTPRLFYDAGIAVFEPGQADWSNFFGIANDPSDGIDPIAFDYTSVIEDIDPTEEFDFYDIFAEVSASVLLGTNYDVYDIFAFTNIFVSLDAGSGLNSFEIDALNTGSYSQGFAPGVNAFSSSGQFLNLPTPPDTTNPIPEPATFLMFSLGLGALGKLRKKQLAA